MPRARSNNSLRPAWVVIGIILLASVLAATFSILSYARCQQQQEGFQLAGLVTGITDAVNAVSGAAATGATALTGAVTGATGTTTQATAGATTTTGVVLDAVRVPTFYTRPSFEGEKFSLSGGHANLTSAEWATFNNQIASMRIPAGYRVLFHRTLDPKDGYWEVSAAQVPLDVPDMKKLFWRYHVPVEGQAPMSLENRISSVIVVPPVFKLKDLAGRYWKVVTVPKRDGTGFYRTMRLASAKGRTVPFILTDQRPIVTEKPELQTAAKNGFALLIDRESDKGIRRYQRRLFLGSPTFATDMFRFLPSGGKSVRLMAAAGGEGDAAMIGYDTEKDVISVYPRGDAHVMSWIIEPEEDVATAATTVTTTTTTVQ